MKKLTAKEKLKRALASLDTAVQEWYKENYPDCPDNYATVHLRNYSDVHCSEITLRDKSFLGYVDIQSSKHTLS